MPKSLGLIHTCDYNFESNILNRGESNAFLCDSSAALSKQFNRNIRMMQSYKLVGADLVVQLPDDLAPPGDNSDRVIVKGRMRYFQPTKGRCNALRQAYEQLRKQAKLQGVDLSNNKLFDFRVLPRARSNYSQNVGTDFEIRNTTTLDGINDLAMIEASDSGSEVFTRYNDGVVPTETVVSALDFTSGLKTQLGTIVTQTDFVRNEGLIQSGNPLIADVEMEDIPFVLTFDATARRTFSMQWRPDPALYVSVLGGFVEIVIDEVDAGGADPAPLNGYEMDITLHWAGWKSIVRPPKKRMTMKKKNRSS